MAARKQAESTIVEIKERGLTLNTAEMPLLSTIVEIKERGLTTNHDEASAEESTIVEIKERGLTSVPWNLSANNLQ